MVNYERIGTASYRLGEGPLWDHDNGTLYWLDLLQPGVFRYDPSSGDIDGWELPGDVGGSMALREKGGAVIAMDRGFHFFDFDTGTCETIVEPEPEKTDTTINDGKADRRGRFFAGSEDLSFKEPKGSLYRLDPDLSWSVVDRGFICANGPCWSPDNSIFYFADSNKHTIYAYDYDIETGELANRRVFLDTRPYNATPDGGTIDADGYLWTTFTETGCIARFAPDGSLDELIETPIEMVTSLTFGGDDMDVLYVTSIGDEIDGLRPSKPDAGGIYAVTGLGAKGLPEPKFAG
ncbi:MAG: SMP-30/gluconolactonase/LRE family protein [Pseudomonadota bacterium]